MKYLIFEDFSGKPVSFLFPHRVDHEDMRNQLPYGQLLAAGYTEMQDGRFRCFGNCPELQAAARPEDAELIAEALKPQV